MRVLDIHLHAHRRCRQSHTHLAKQEDQEASRSQRLPYRPQVDIILSIHISHFGIIFLQHR